MQGLRIIENLKVFSQPLPDVALQQRTPGLQDFFLDFAHRGSRRRIPHLYLLPRAVLASRLGKSCRGTDILD